MATVQKHSDDLRIELPTTKILTLAADSTVVSGTLTVNALSITGDLTVGDDLTVTNDLTVNDDCVVQGTLSVNSGITNLANLTLTALLGTLGLAASVGDITMTAADDIIIEATDTFSIACDDLSISITGAAASTIDAVGNLTIKTDGSLILEGDDGNNDTILTLSNGGGASLVTTVTGGYALEVENLGTGASTSALQLKINTVSPDVNNMWVRFLSSASTVRGRIRGAATSSSSVFVSADSTDNAAAATTGGAADVESGAAGDVVYASGASDFGEWVEIGNINEWALTPEQIEEAKKGFYFGLPEGYVVYVREGKFFREGPGTPLVVTHRALLVGNERDSRIDYCGQVLSFIGQVPVYAHGRVNTGDFLIPSGDFYCTAVSSDQITFEQYKKSIGIAWESSDKETLKKVLCAIGVKNSF